MIPGNGIGSAPMSSNTVAGDEASDSVKQLSSPPTVPASTNVIGGAQETRDEEDNLAESANTPTKKVRHSHSYDDRSLLNIIL